MKSTYAEHQARLESACEWLGIDFGRAARYSHLLKEFVEENKRSREHILVYSESCEVVELCELWKNRVAYFPDLEGRIKDTLRKGPLLREDERATISSNRARNDAFVYLVAGTFMKAEVSVVAVEGIATHSFTCQSSADITVKISERLVDIECKRPQAYSALLKRTKEARKQIARVDRLGRDGVIAIDCSVLVRPRETVLESASLSEAESHVSKLLELNVMPKITSCLSDSIVGFLLFARVPAMTALAIFAKSGEPVYRSDCVKSWLMVGNSEHADLEVLRCVGNRLHETIHTF